MTSVKVCQIMSKKKKVTVVNIFFETKKASCRCNCSWCSLHYYLLYYGLKKSYISRLNKKKWALYPFSYIQFCSLVHVTFQYFSWENVLFYVLSVLNSIYSSSLVWRSMPTCIEKALSPSTTYLHSFLHGTYNWYSSG